VDKDKNRSSVVAMNNGSAAIAEILQNEEEDDEIEVIYEGSSLYFDLIYGLCRMFEEIDINGDDRMAWTELTQFLLDNVNKRSKQTVDL
jgi:hypothetical protein